MMYDKFISCENAQKYTSPIMSKETRTTSTALRNSNNRKHNTDQKEQGVEKRGTANETAEKRTIDSRQQNNTE